MFKNMFVAIMVSLLTVCLCPLSRAAQGAREAEGSGFETSKEKIGELRLDLKEQDLPSLISCAPQKGKEIYEGATGERVQTWKYPDCGIALKMASERKGGKKVVRSISLAAPGKLATARGIHIGSTEAEVIQAYGRYKDQDGGTEKGKRFVAGSIFDGMIFDFRGGKVVGIFLGAAAE